MNKRGHIDAWNMVLVCFLNHTGVHTPGGGGEGGGGGEWGVEVKMMETAGDGDLFHMPNYLLSKGNM